MAKELNKMTPEELGILFPIILAEYNPEWPAFYLKEETRIKKSLPSGTLFRISHIGSTAIPGLISKPTIDILLEVSEKTEDQSIIDSFIELGYQFISRPENPAPHMMFVLGYTPKGFRGQAVHVHVRYPGDWHEIRFRDYLQTHPESREEYEKLKQELAVRYRNDRDGYTDAKEEFIRRIHNLAGSSKDQAAR
jgi:GrpB-like predicted nucleotidyltransferase (UPF0157 family)